MQVTLAVVERVITINKYRLSVEMWRRIIRNYSFQRESQSQLAGQQRDTLMWN